MKQFGNLVKQAQQMQARIMKLQEEAGLLTARATSGGGAVTVEANAKGEIVSLKIAPEAVSPEDVVMLEELVVIGRQRGAAPRPRDHGRGDEETDRRDAVSRPLLNPGAR